MNPLRCLTISLLLALMGFLAGWYACEWIEQDMERAGVNRMTTIPAPVQQVP